MLPLISPLGEIKETGHKMHKEIYDKLKVVAKAGQVTHYSEVAPLAGLDMSLQEDRNRIATILDEISTSEHHEGHPLLSAVVIHKDDNMPGQGFFTLARRLGLHKGEDNFLFFIQELRRVHDYWS